MAPLENLEDSFELEEEEVEFEQIRRDRGHCSIFVVGKEEQFPSCCVYTEFIVKNFMKTIRAVLRETFPAAVQSSRTAYSSGTIDFSRRTIEQ